MTKNLISGLYCCQINIYNNINIPVLDNESMEYHVFQTNYWHNFYDNHIIKSIMMKSVFQRQITCIKIHNNTNHGLHWNLVSYIITMSDHAIWAWTRSYQSKRKIQNIYRYISSLDYYCMNLGPNRAKLDELGKQDHIQNSEAEIIILHAMELSSDQICQSYFLACKLSIKLFSYHPIQCISVISTYMPNNWKLGSDCYQPNNWQLGQIVTNQIIDNQVRLLPTK